MAPRIGVVGLIGALVLLGGVGMIAYSDPVVAAGVLAVVVGLALVVKDLISNLLANFGFL